MKKQQIIFGIHAVEAVLNHRPEQVLDLWVLQDRDDQRVASLLKIARDYGIAIQKTSRKALDDRADNTQHQGILLRVNGLKPLDDNDLWALIEKTAVPLLLILDGVTDPHNLGACLRNAAAAGVQGVIVPRDNSAGLTSTVAKVACGAAEVVPLFQITNLARVMKRLQQQGVWLVGLAGEAEQSLYQLDLNGGLAMVMGAEDKGLRRLTRENCDSLAAIPMVGGISSVNVSVAAGICLFEAVRQRPSSPA